MRVFHFRNTEFGIKSLKERRLKIARVAELNDPFEFLGMELSDRKFRKHMNVAKSKFSESTGILCFSASWKNPVQWTHYAEQHTGIAMGFDVPDKLLSEIAYVTERLPMTAPIDNAIMEQCLTTKFAHWAYEEEYRRFIPLAPIKQDNALYFLPFSDNLRLREVIVGSRSSLSRSQVADALGTFAPEVTVFKSRPAFRTFDVVRNQNEKLWV
jgi:hypothetical protein